MQVLQYIVDLGATVMIPIVIFIVGLIFGNGIGKSLKSGISVGIGFTGISLVISFWVESITS